MFVGRFSSRAKQRVEQLAQISFENTSEAEFVEYGLDFGDLFCTLLRTKTQMIEQSQSQLGYLGRNNFITIFAPTKRQAASG